MERKVCVCVSEAKWTLNIDCPDWSRDVPRYKYIIQIEQSVFYIDTNAIHYYPPENSKAILLKLDVCTGTGIPRDVLEKASETKFLKNKIKAPCCGMHLQHLFIHP